MNEQREKRRYVVFFALFVISAVIAAGGCVLIADSYGAMRELGFAVIGALAWYGTFKLGCSVLFWFETVGDTSSPRPWRCFLKPTSHNELIVVFSTSVEVFPQGTTVARVKRCLLHVRGGVSSLRSLR